MVLEIGEKLLILWQPIKLVRMLKNTITTSSSTPITSFLYSNSKLDSECDFEAWCAGTFDKRRQRGIWKKDNKIAK